MPFRRTFSGNPKGCHLLPLFRNGRPPRLSPSVTIPTRRVEMTLANLYGIVKQLKKERDRVQHQLSGLNAALAAFARGYAGNTETNDVSIGSSQDRCGSKTALGQTQATEEEHWE